MTTPVASYLTKVQIAPDSSESAGAYASPSNQQGYKASLKGDQIDISQINSAGYKQRITGLLDLSVSVDVFLDYADTAQSTLLSAFTGRTAVWVKGFIDATHFITGQCNVESLDFTEDPSGATRMTAQLTLRATGASPLTIS